MCFDRFFIIFVNVCLMHKQKLLEVNLDMVESEYHLGWAMRKLVSGVCGQRRPRSACASAQSDQGFNCPLTESLDTIKGIIGAHMSE